MSNYSLSHLSDGTLVHGLTAAVTGERTAIAVVLAHIAEFDARKLYLPAAYPSTYAYCVGKLRLSEGAAFRRITAARMARRFPAIFDAVADGRLHLSAVSLLAPHLTEDTAEQLLAAASHKTKAEVEQLLAERFPRPDVLAWVTPIPAPPVAGPAAQLLPEPDANQLIPGRVDGNILTPSAPAPARAPGHTGAHARVVPLSAQSFDVQFTLSRAGHEDLRCVQELLGHQVHSGEVAAVIEMALKELRSTLERRKFAATSRPRRGPPRSSTDSRHVPAEVRRAVWKRDQGQCTFVSETGHRCQARRGIEFDHVEEFARGGEATIGGVRLRCRAHNQFEAERTYGPEFMRRKREQARERAAEARAVEAGGQPAQSSAAIAGVPG